MAKVVAQALNSGEDFGVQTDDIGNDIGDCYKKGLK